MKKNTAKSSNSSFERKALIAFLIIFVGVIGAAWVYALNLRETIAAKNAVVNVNPKALVEVERLRNIAESQIANSRSYFLLGSKSLYDQQREEKDALLDSLAKFERNYDLPKIPDIVKRITALEQQNQEFFDQAMDFREKQTESKIVGQFYQSKTSPIRKQINESLDEIVQIHNAELDRARTEAQKAAKNAETQIPLGMTWLTGLLGFIILGMSFLVVRMIRGRAHQTADRDRLYNEAQKALQGRDEVIAAISHDLKEPLGDINKIAESIKHAKDPNEILDNVGLLKNSVIGIESVVKDISDQKNSDMGSLSLRLDQLGIDEILDDARLMLQPLAKTKDIRLQFDTANPPVLAFFDRERVIRVLSNLVGNAIKFSPKHSKVIVKVRSDQQFVHVSVADAGPGIPDKQLPEIFDHFWQARKTADQGAGVGLAVAKTIIEAHGGTLRVENSHVGQGSIFTFTLPRRRPVGAQIKKAGPNRPVVRTQPSEAQEGLSL